MKKSILFIAGIMLLLAFTQCKKNEKTDQELANDAIVFIDNNIQSQLDLLDEKEIPDAINSLSTWLSEQDGVSSVKAENGSIEITFEDGTNAAVRFYDKTIVPSMRIHELNNCGEGNKATKAYFDTPVGNQLVFVWDAFEAEFITEFEGTLYNEGDTIQKLFETEGFQVEHKKNSECTVDSFKQITQYGYVQFITHGSTSTLATKEHVLTNLLKYTSEISDGQITREYHIYKTQLGFNFLGCFYAVTDKFITELPNDFNNTIIYNAACSGMGTTDAPLKEAFLQKHAGTYLGYSNSVETVGSYVFSRLFVTHLLQGLLTGQSYDQTLSLVSEVNYGSYSTTLLIDGSRDVSWYGTSSCPEGAINSLFTINDHGGKVCFAQGNLQYQASTNTWRFAPNQYDHIGNDNTNVSSYYSGWIDLFCWGTSGWNSGAQEYEPYAQSTSPQSYYTGGSPDIDLTGDYADADWAYHNPISNGGQQSGLWRCLTHEEYIYMMESRADADQKYGYARVNGINGLVILPDDWTLPDGLSFAPQANAWNSNSYSIEQWSQMEAAGAIFLPTTGTRQGTRVFYVDGLGDYWSSTANDAETGSSMSFFNGNVYPGDCRYRFLGTSVRAAHDM